MDENEGRIWRSARPRISIVNGRTDWYRIDNKAETDSAEVYIYDEIGYLGTTAKDFVNDLRGISKTRINLHLNSPGGDVFDGIAIYNGLKNHPAQVVVMVDGLAASAASFIAMAGDKVVMMPHSKMMIHEAFGLTIGNSEDMRKMAERLDATSNNIAAIYAERAGGTADEWRQRMTDETWYSDKEAVAAGLADEVGRGEEDNRQVASFDLSIFRNSPENQTEIEAEIEPAPEGGSDAPEQAGEQPISVIEARRRDVDAHLISIGV